MLRRKSLVGMSIAFVLIILAASTLEARVRNYSRRAYTKALQNGEAVFLDYHATWCPTCRQQKPIIDKLARQKRYKDIRFFRVDYERQLKIKRKHKVRRQSTFVLLKGGQELGRLQASTSESEIVKLLNRALYVPVIKKYSDRLYDESMKDGKTVVLDFAASWCPTCRKQHKIIKNLLADPAMANVIVLKVDYDSSRGLKRQHRVRNQSTIIVYKNGEEQSRSIGETDPEKLRDQFLLQ